jgi:FlaA1/EpsC-like NDP-sugar epimerase
MGIMHGGELFVPKLPSMRILDLVSAIAPECAIKYIGIRPGEKIHETLLPKDESPRTIEFKDFFLIQPNLNFWKKNSDIVGGRPIAEDFEYVSGTNSHFLTAKELRQQVGLLFPEEFRRMELERDKIRAIC